MNGLTWLNHIEPVEITNLLALLLANLCHTVCLCFEVKPPVDIYNAMMANSWLQGTNFKKCIDMNMQMQNHVKPGYQDSAGYMSTPAADLLGMKHSSQKNKHCNWGSASHKLGAKLLHSLTPLHCFGENSMIKTLTKLQQISCDCSVSKRGFWSSWGLLHI